MPTQLKFRHCMVHVHQYNLHLLSILQQILDQNEIPRHRPRLFQYCRSIIDDKGTLAFFVGCVADRCPHYMTALTSAIRAFAQIVDVELSPSPEEVCPRLFRFLLENYIVRYPLLDKSHRDNTSQLDTLEKIMEEFCILSVPLPTYNRVDLDIHNPVSESKSDPPPGRTPPRTPPGTLTPPGCTPPRTPQRTPTPSTPPSIPPVSKPSVVKSKSRLSIKIPTPYQTDEEVSEYSNSD